jgi:hypothetical protein
MKQYLKATTKVRIERTVRNPYQPGGWATMTWGEAQRDDALSTSSGTVSVEIELDPSERHAFAGCADGVRFDVHGNAYCRVLDDIDEDDA